ASSDRIAMTAIPLTALIIAPSRNPQPLTHRKLTGMGTELARELKVPHADDSGSRWPPERVLGRRHDLSGVEDILRIERLFQGPHGVERLHSQFCLQIFLLALADPMLAGAGAAHRLRALDEAMHELLTARHLVLVVDIAKQRAMEIAI